MYADILPKTESKEIGVLSSWFSPTADPIEYRNAANKVTTVHSFHPLQSYRCTLSQGCFEVVEGSSATCVFSNNVSVDNDKVALITARKGTLSTDTVNYISTLHHDSKEIHSGMNV